MKYKSGGGPPQSKEPVGSEGKSLLKFDKFPKLIILDELPEKEEELRITKKQFLIDDENRQKRNLESFLK